MNDYKQKMFNEKLNSTLNILNSITYDMYYVLNYFFPKF